MVLRWFRERGCVHCLARDAGVSQATGYRYLHEAIDVLAAQAANLHQVLKECQAKGLSHVILDGTLIETGRVAGTHMNNKGKEVDTWYSGKHRAFGATVPVRAGRHPAVGERRQPGSTNDIVAAREHCLPALYKSAADGLPTLMDSGYQGAGIGIHHPLAKPQGSSCRIGDIARAALGLNGIWK